MYNDDFVNTDPFDEEVTPDAIKQILLLSINTSDIFNIEVYDKNLKFLGSIICIRKILLDNNMLNSISNILFEYISKYKGRMIIKIRDIYDNNGNESDYPNYSTDDPIDEFIKSFE